MINNRIYLISPTYVTSCYILFAYSDVKGGQGGIASNNGTVYWQEGNIDNDPFFTDAANDDFSLQAGSPAIDAGTAYYEWQSNVIVNLNVNSYS